MTSSPHSSGMSLNALVSARNFWSHCENGSKHCVLILKRVLFYTAESDAPWCHGSHISSSMWCGPNVTSCSLCFIMRAILRAGLVGRNVPANRRIDTDRYAADHAGRYAFNTAHRRNRPMLQLRPNCECCNRDLPPQSEEALICSFECTFCRACASSVLKGKCPNCGGELVARPRRPAEKLAKFPASTERVFKPEGCANAA